MEGLWEGQPSGYWPLAGVYTKTFYTLAACLREVADPAYGIANRSVLK
jgi:hypothetical protein